MSLLKAASSKLVYPASTFAEAMDVRNPVPLDFENEPELAERLYIPHAARMDRSWIFHYNILREVHQPNLRPNAASRDLGQSWICEYANDRTWFDIHPLLRKAVDLAIQEMS